jgi:hypothetical protein
MPSYGSSEPEVPLTKFGKPHIDYSSSKDKTSFHIIFKDPFQIGCVEIGEAGQNIFDRKSLKPDLELSPLHKDSKDLSEKQDLRIWNKTGPSFRSAASFPQDSAAFLLRSDMNNESDSNSMISRKWHGQSDH